jgi:hypothetical protein
MQSITIGCPVGGNITVHGTSSGSGAGTICVCGHYASGFFIRMGCLNLILAIIKGCLNWSAGLFKSKTDPLTTLTAPFVRVRVVKGTVTTYPSSAYVAGDVDVNPSGQSWCAKSVPAPDSSASGAALTAFAWLFNSTGGVDDKKLVNFKGGGPNPIDCCSASCCAASAHTSQLATELASPARLEVNIQDGPNAGHHLAKSVSHLTWEANIRGMSYKISGDAGSALVIQGPSSSITSRVVESSPFSAIFPGTLFGAVRDVVVTKA